MLFLKTKLFKISLISLLSMCIGCAIFCTPSFADDNEIIDNSGDSIPISAEDDLIIRESSNIIAESVYSTSDVRATDYAQLIYNYLVNTIHQDLSTMNGYNSSMNTRLLNIQNSLNGGSTNNTSLYSLISNLNTMITGSSTSGVSIRDLDLLICDFMFGGTASYPSGFLWSSLQSIQAAVVSSSSNIYSAVSKLNDINNNILALNNITWNDYSSSFTLQGVSSSLNGSYYIPTSNTQFDEIFYKISVSGSMNGFNGLKLVLPCSVPNTNSFRYDLYLSIDNIIYKISNFQYFASSRDIYILNFPSNIGSGPFILHQYLKDVDGAPAGITYQISRSLQAFRSNSDALTSLEYFSNLAIFDINNKLSNLDKLTEELASDDMIAAKEESKQVIDDTLDGFTGDGSAAAKISDTSSLKSVSGDIRSGLAGGGSVGNATSVFNNNSNFWDWFTQTTSDNINNPYPAPVVEQTRRFDDEILDFLTPNTQEVQDLLHSESEER